MSRACPELVRKGVVVRIEDSGEPGSRVIAHEFVDLRFADGYLERWIGMGWARAVPSVAAPMGELMTWADQVAQAFDGNLRYDLRVDWKDAPPPEAFADIPTEVVVEWNATLPDEAFGDHR
jgi:hypothetical protein